MKRSMTFLTAVLAGTSALAADGPKISGNVVPKWTYTDPGLSSASSSSTFGVADGALELSHKIEGFDAYIDIPFNGGANGAAFDIATATTQAYIGTSWDFGLSAKVGQFDTPFGLEGNDVADNTFATGGIIAAHLPTVHRGASFGYAVTDMIDVTAIVANPSTWVGGTGGDDTGSETPDTALNLALNFGDIKANLGALHGSWNERSRIGYFANLTMKMDALSAGLEYFTSRDNAVMATGHKDWKMGYGLHGVYGVNDWINAGLRAQWTMFKDAKRMQITAGPQFKMEENFQVRVDYTFDQSNIGDNGLGNFAAGTKGNKNIADQILAVAGVYTF